MIYLNVGDNMASRMDRYRQNREKRSTKNESLYQQLREAGSYSNIEGIATIEKTNEIDITKVKAMLQNRENYQKQKQYNRLMEKEEISNEEELDLTEEEKNYDIKEVLDKAKEDWDKPNDPHRSLKNIHYDILNRLKLKATPEEEQELKELIDTIALRSQQGDDSEDGGLLDDLKSNTMVGDATSIKKIIDEAKEEEAKQAAQKKDEERSMQFDTTELDKSFYTSSMEFSAKDFEGLKGLETSIKKHNLLLTILIVVAVVGGLIGLIFLLIKFIM